MRVRKSCIRDDIYTDAGKWAREGQRARVRMAEEGEHGWRGCDGV